MNSNPLIHFYRTPALADSEVKEILLWSRENISSSITGIDTEYCFNTEVTEDLTAHEMKLLMWLLSETFEPKQFGRTTFLTGTGTVLEVGPRMNFTTAWSANAVSICHSCGLKGIKRIERSRRYLLIVDNEVTTQQREIFLQRIHDRMTECPYVRQLETFETGLTPESWFEIPLMEEGRQTLEKINEEMGLAFDEWDIAYYTKLFTEEMGRNPTNVECFDIAQSNSEHSRHWFFRGKLVIDGEEIPDHLMKIIQRPHKANKGNSIIAFNDNSSAIKGYPIQTIIPERPGTVSRFVKTKRNYYIIFTAETHNFPTGVAPFPGAETGTGGRIRDVHATGKGSLVVAGSAAYCVGNLRIPGYRLPWEDDSFAYPENLASPLEIELEASNGASDYGNKFGEPVILGYTRSFGLRLPGGERREWIKPIMFTGGIGQIDADHVNKLPPEKGMLIVKIGGPAYRIGMGGGAASSMLQGENVAELDFNAVQRGDAEMEQKVNRVIRSCVELGSSNPLISIHDQGAGGNCNVVKEIIEPAGAKINIREILLGDDTLSVLEIWGAEYQEQDALLLKPEHADMFKAMCKREKVPVAFIGEITGDGRILLHDSSDDSAPVDMELKKVLGSMPQKTFKSNYKHREYPPLEFPDDLTVREALKRVFRLLSVGSKRFLTNKVDRSVTGLIAQQQCTGPLQLPVSDVAVIAQSHFGITGAATAIGEQPVKGLIDPDAMARMCVGEALTNLVWARVSTLEDVKCSANWMWAAKLPGEGAALYRAAVAMSDIMIQLGIAVDGGKDSISMAAAVTDKEGNTEIVKAPGSLVISAYVTCPDITKTVTPDLKHQGKGKILFIDLGRGKNRVGGSALAQVYGQVGDTSPDVEDPSLLKRAFNAVQGIIEKGLISAGHDRSDGGLVTTLVEMAFAGNCGIDIEMDDKYSDPLSMMFSEELGLVFEYTGDNEEEIFSRLKEARVDFEVIGRTLPEKKITVKCNGEIIIEENMAVLRDRWEETSFELEKLQANPACVEQEKQSVSSRTGMQCMVSFVPRETPENILNAEDKHRVAIIREEGSNGDREMTSAFYMAGFEPWDVTMTDLLERKITLDTFRGVVFVGGFSYADVLDSAKGWSGAIRFNKKIWKQFQEFYKRSDTFSLGVCNGCQLMALLGWVPWQGLSNEIQPRFISNMSGRFESRFSNVVILPSPSIMLEGMEDALLGIWVAHGEGRAYFPDSETLKQVKKQNLAPVRYIDDNGEITESYPFNPNGSPEGIASLCSPDGRHLAMMPHPERVFLKWQWGWIDEEMKQNLQASPWLRMFQNARKWCDGNG